MSKLNLNKCNRNELSFVCPSIHPSISIRPFNLQFVLTHTHLKYCIFTSSQMRVNLWKCENVTKEWPTVLIGRVRIAKITVCAAIAINAFFNTTIKWNWHDIRINWLWFVWIARYFRLVMISQNMNKITIILAKIIANRKISILPIRLLLE